VAFSPDGGRIVSGSKDGTIKIWDTVIDRERLTLETKRGGRPIFSPDGTRIFSEQYGIINEWDVATGTQFMTPPVWTDFASVALSPDGKRIVSGCYDRGIRRIKVWDTTTGAELMSFPEQKSVTYCWVLLSRDGKRIVTCDFAEKVVRIWDAVTCTKLVSFDHGSFAFSLAISPDGERIVMGCQDKTIKIWKSATGEEILTLRGHTDSVWAVAFSPDGKYIASGDGKGMIKLWDAARGKELITVQGHALRLNSVAFSPDGKRIISSGRDGMVKLWDTATGTEVLTLPGHEFSSAIFSPDGKTIAIGTILLETETPPNGYGPRRTGAAARKLVDELYEKHGLYQQVIDELKRDKAFVEPVQRIALQIASARLPEDVKKLNQESMEVVSSPGREIDMYQDALEKAKKANELELGGVKASILTIQGMAQYRLGDYEEALETLSESTKIASDYAISAQQILRPDPANLAFRAMSLYQLGRNDDAQVALAQLRLSCSETRFSKDERAQAFLAEAKRLIIKEGEWLESTEPGNPYAETVTAYEQRLRLSPDSAEAHCGLAWLLATCPVDGVRDGVPKQSNTPKRPAN
jgi:hypothetical protein